MLTLVIPLLASGTAEAALAVCGVNAPRAAGTISTAPSSISDYTEGTYGELLVRNAPVCDSDRTGGNTVSLRTMISGANGQGWAQSGVLRWYGSPWYHFSQYKRDGQTPHVTKIKTAATVPNNTWHVYQQAWTRDCLPPPEVACVMLWADTSVLDTTNFDPWNFHWQSPFVSSWTGLNRYLESDQPGLPQSQARTDYLWYQEIVDNAWLPFRCSQGAGVNDNPSRWGRNQVACWESGSYTKVAIWTDRP